MAEKHDLLDDIIDITNNWGAVSKPVETVMNGISFDPETAPQWDPSKYKERPRPNSVRCLSVASKDPKACTKCQDACPVNAISQRDDAIQLNESLCIGCKLCAVVCPFGAISASGSRPVNAPAQYVFQAEGSLKDGEENVPPQHALLRWEPGVQTVAVKCDLCDFLPEGPACVRACPNQALRLITDDSLQRQMKEKQRLAASWFANGGEDPLSLTQEQR